MKNHVVITTLFCLFLQAYAQASSTPTSTSSQAWMAYWSLFKANPKEAMSRLPEHRSTQPGKAPFSNQSIATKGYLKAKDQSRQDICQRAGAGPDCRKARPLADFNGLWEVQSFLPQGTTMWTHLQEIEDQDALKGRVAQQPWSGDYWPMYLGGIAARYASPKFYRSTNWTKMEKVFKDYPKGNFSEQKFLDLLSPGEKYDLLANDRKFTITNAAIEEGREYFKQEGEVETWFGICHGWAPASYMTKRPTQTLQLKLEGDLNINLYPHDLKALASQLWAKNGFATHFIGGRCNDKEPKLDENGRVISSECFDANPGTWHLVVTNMLGQLKKSLVIDAHYDWQVWNQPLLAYSYEYFNVNDKKTYNKFREAVVDVNSMSNDIFKKYRSANAKYVVGIKMELQYIKETEATHLATDDESQDNVTFVDYIYDLELDENYQILGGEWYQLGHPDMLWTPYVNSRPWTRYEPMAVSIWDAKSIMPWDWQRAALWASKEQSPLAKVLHALGL